MELLEFVIQLQLRDQFIDFELFHRRDDYDLQQQKKMLEFSSMFRENVIDTEGPVDRMIDATGTGIPPEFL